MSKAVTLPERATPASRYRAELALKLAQVCPPHLADEIALVGSTAHGYADDESDLELNLWAEAIPPLDARLEWLRAAGATDIHAEPAPRPDDSYWIGFTVDGISGEAGWQTYAALEIALETLLSGKAERKALAFGDILTSALPLRTMGSLATWQARLSGYSDAVQHGIIAEAVERWSRSGTVAAAHRLARRGERIALMQMLLDDLDMAMRVLYAVHRRWEPSRKWTLTLAQDFAPNDLLPSIDAVLGDESLEQRVTACARLCIDVLELLPLNEQVSAALAALRAGFGWTMTPEELEARHTSFVSVTTVLKMLIPKMKMVLGAKLAGVYLYGSLVLGDFDADISDIDLLAALTDDLTDAEFAALDAMHGEMVAAQPEWDDRIEIAYVTLEALRTFKTVRCPLAVISPGESFHFKDAGIDWLINWYIVREKGVTLLGAPPQSIIPPISQAEYVEEVKAHVQRWRSWVNEEMDRPLQAYAIMTLCRAYYTVVHGEHTSKRKAALWAAERMPEWKSTIENAFLWRAAWRDKNVDPTATLENTRRFVNHVADKILE